MLDKGHKVMITGRNIETTKEIASDLGVGFKIVDAANFDDLDKILLLNYRAFLAIHEARVKFSWFLEKCDHLNL